MLQSELLLGGRYRLDARIGAGGMGEVWQAVDQVLGRVVAVKAMLPDVAGEPGFAKRFLVEAKAMASVNHQAVASIHDYGHSDGITFLVMEFIDGASLAQILSRRGRLAAPDVMRLVAQAADGLEAVHDCGIVHRDIKPANLLIRRNGALLITDFGISRTHGGTQLTASGAMLGTPTYLSPEQVLGQPASALSDVYSLGLVAYECLAGRRPFEGDNPFAVALQRVRAAPRTLGGDIQPSVLAVVEGALAVDPSQRWPSAAALADAARSAAADAAGPRGGVDRPLGPALRQRPPPPNPAPPYGPSGSGPASRQGPSTGGPVPPYARSSGPGSGHGPSSGSPESGQGRWSGSPVPSYGPPSSGPATRQDPLWGSPAAPHGPSSSGPGSTSGPSSFGPVPPYGSPSSDRTTLHGPPSLDPAPRYGSGSFSPAPPHGSPSPAGTAKRRTGRLVMAGVLLVVVAVSVAVWAMNRDTGKGKGGLAAGADPTASSAASTDPTPSTTAPVEALFEQAGLAPCGDVFCPVTPMCWDGLVSSSGRTETPRPVDCAELHYWETFVAVGPPTDVATSSEDVLIERPDVAPVCSADVMASHSSDPARTGSWDREAWLIEVPGTESRLLHCLASSEQGGTPGSVFTP